MASKELLILRMLLDNPTRGMYGSELVHLSEGRIGRGTVYTVLERLVNKGFVREVEEPPTPDLALKRTRHHITASGRAAYNAFLTEHGLRIAGRIGAAA
jgi:DNA-binding PadR family transcriptional regulator